ncbi:early nodulin-like protein 18 [Nicotiana tabacum]|uniref:Cucumber peeling cupredoxin-like n=2 Tax=Nicotiana TaxID=4085 RepID=A0A1S3YT09_TOBAC|nr:PREDICTED: cucumber peeling cupredoxin-like [Nicotiana sylvestris]XP_016455172.1 PREDICTED: cucumber peeling cupredoxin-like [Nicotiana tabacum]
MAMAVDSMVFFVAVALFFNLAASQSTAKYTNHTVGGPAGWFYNINTKKTSADYSAWAAKQTFNLGDYLIFSTNTNQTVIQTYNETTYRNCSMDDASDDDTFQYQGGSNEFGEAMTVAVPLTIEGAQYYFSDADDGTQCLNGMAFEIKVGHGIGLPPNLNQPPPPPYVEPPSTVEAESPPITVVTNRPNGGGVRSSTGLFLVVSILVVLVLHLV